MNKKICSYSLGYMGQGAAYNFMSTYFIVFMTDCVGMSSALSSTIMSLALLAEVLAGMTVGSISDGCSSRMGRRRPFILLACLTLPLIILLLFSTGAGSGRLQFAYYLILSICFRISFSCYEIPAGALGAEIATGYDERITLRTASRLFGILGNTIAYTLPLFALELTARQQDGWRLAAVVIACVCFFTWLTSFILTRPYAKPAGSKRPQRKLFKEVFTSYFELSRLKPMRILIIYKASFACAIALFNTGTVYYMRCCAGFSNTYISYVYFITSAVFLITTPLINKMALRMGKARQQKIMLAAAGTAGLGFFLLGSASGPGVFLYIVIFAVAQNSFWQLSPSIFYDIVEVDEFVNGKKREGDIMSLVSVLGTLCTSVAVQLFGLALDMSGYDAALASQPVAVSTFLSAAYVLTPSLCFLAGALALLRFPIDKDTFNALKQAVLKKNAGEDYSRYSAALERILK